MPALGLHFSALPELLESILVDSLHYFLLFRAQWSMNDISILDDVDVFITETSYLVYDTMNQTTFHPMIPSLLLCVKNKRNARISMLHVDKLYSSDHCSRFELSNNHAVCTIIERETLKIHRRCIFCKLFHDADAIKERFGIEYDVSAFQLQLRANSCLSCLQ